MNTHTEDNATLAGIRVIEFCQIAAGPFCGMLLGDLGADVVKVEPPGGDAMRQWPPLKNGFSENFSSVNRNKRSIALNLKTGSDLAVARKLIKCADVVLENNRPGVMQRLGLDYPTVSAAHPMIVYCSISAFGQTGPRAHEGAFDVTMQAISGIMSVTGEAHDAPVKCGVPISDFGTGLYAAMHICAALRARETTGRGAYIDASMLGASLGIAPLQISEYFGNRENPKRLGSRHPRNAPYQAFKAADGYFVLAAGNQRLWQIVCEQLEQPNLFSDERFCSTEKRAANQDQLQQILENLFATNRADYWIGRFRSAGVPVAPINRYGEALQDAQVVDQGWVQPLDLPGAGQTSTFAHPIRVDGKNLPIRSAPPLLDEHHEEILRQWLGH